MKFNIEIRYRTGNSFGTHDETEILECAWENLEAANESAIRIGNHYKYINDFNFFTKPKGEAPKGVDWDEEYKHNFLTLIDDDGNEFRISAPWVGWFEKLYTVKIIIDLPEIEFD